MKRVERVRGSVIIAIAMVVTVLIPTAVSAAEPERLDNSEPLNDGALMEGMVEVEADLSNVQTLSKTAIDANLSTADAPYRQFYALPQVREQDGYNVRVRREGSEALSYVELCLWYVEDGATSGLKEQCRNAANSSSTSAQPFRNTIDQIPAYISIGPGRGATGPVDEHQGAYSISLSSIDRRIELTPLFTGPLELESMLEFQVDSHESVNVEGAEVTINVKYFNKYVGGSGRVQDGKVVVPISLPPESAGDWVSLEFMSPWSGGFGSYWSGWRVPRMEVAGPPKVKATVDMSAHIKATTPYHTKITVYHTVNGEPFNTTPMRLGYTIDGEYHEIKRGTTGKSTTFILNLATVEDGVVTLPKQPVTFTAVIDESPIYHASSMRPRVTTVVDLPYLVPSIPRVHIVPSKGSFPVTITAATGTPEYANISAVFYIPGVGGPSGQASIFNGFGNLEYDMSRWRGREAQLVVIARGSPYHHDGATSPRRVIISHERKIKYEIPKNLELHGSGTLLIPVTGTNAGLIEGESTNLKVQVGRSTYLFTGTIRNGRAVFNYKLPDSVVGSASQVTVSNPLTAGLAPSSSTLRGVDIVK